MKKNTQPEPTTPNKKAVTKPVEKNKPKAKVSENKQPSNPPKEKASITKKAPVKKETVKPKQEPKKTTESAKNNLPVAPTAKRQSKEDREVNKRKSERQKEDRIVSKIVTVLVVILLFIGGILAFSVVHFISSSLKPLDKSDSAKVTVEIPSGSSNKMIGEILEEEHVIKSGMVFNYYTKFNNLTGFQAGTYEFSPDMTLAKIGKNLQNGGEGTLGSDVKLTIPEGYDIDKIGDTIAENTTIKKKEFIALMNDDDFFDQLHEQYPDLLDSVAEAEDVKYRLEGYLFPATYDYYKTSTLEDVVTQMVAKTDAVLSPYYEEIAAQGMTVQEVLTLASLVEKEGVTEADRKKIAQVFVNRVNVGMPIQSDISILYALGEHKEFVTLKDTEVDSPYNLYTNTGYGPGPFDSPSEQSIKAVLNPTPNNYYYFVADIDTGNVYYAETYEEHLELVEKYVNNK
ncbi:MAG: endolytic transglycosylase MltG [Enterococcus sp.]